MQERAGGGLYFNVLNRFATLAAMACKVKALLQVPLTLAAFHPFLSRSASKKRWASQRSLLLNGNLSYSSQQKR